MNELKALEKAVEIAGGQTALATKCAAVANRKCTQANVWSWMHRSKRVAHEWALPVETVTGISRHELRPDIFGAQPIPASEARAS